MRPSRAVGIGWNYMYTKAVIGKPICQAVNFNVFFGFSDESAHARLHSNSTQMHVFCPSGVCTPSTAALFLQ